MQMTDVYVALKLREFHLKMISQNYSNQIRLSEIVKRFPVQD